MVNVGQANRDLLIALIRKNTEKFIESLPKMMVHNFSNEKPYFSMEIRVSASEFEVEVLKRENEILKKRLQRLKDSNETTE